MNDTNDTQSAKSAPRTDRAGRRTSTEDEWAALLLVATAGTWVRFRVGDRDHRMPLALSFVLIGFFLWVAENAATYVGAWSYPHQLDGWQPVSLAKFGAWALLMTVTFVLAMPSRSARHEN